MVNSTANYVISRSNPQDLMLAYNVPYFTPGDIDGFLTSLARVGARMKKVNLPLASPRFVPYHTDRTHHSLTY